MIVYMLIYTLTPVGALVFSSACMEPLWVGFITFHAMTGCLYEVALCLFLCAQLRYRQDELHVEVLAEHTQL